MKRIQNSISSNLNSLPLELQACARSCIRRFINKTQNIRIRLGSFRWNKILTLPLGLIVLFNGSDSLSDTDLLRRVGHYAPVSDILEIFLSKKIPRINNDTNWCVSIRTKRYLTGLRLNVSQPVCWLRNIKSNIKIT